MIDFDKVKETLKVRGYDVLEKIGQGGYGACYKVYSHQYDSYFACKVMSFDDKMKARQELNFQNELHALMNIIHPFIIKVFNTFRTTNELYFILEYCPHGDLYRQVMKEGPIEGQKLVQYAVKLLEALIYLEEKNLTHNDIKPANILIDQYGRPKLADFGLSKQLKTLDDLSDDFTGSPAYLAPEVLNQKTYSPIKADIWSFGMTIFFLATRRFPFDTKSIDGLRTFAKTGYYEIPPDLHPDIKFIIQKTLIVDPNRRMSFVDLYSHLKKSQSSVITNVTMPNIQLPMVNKARNGHRPNKVIRLSLSAMRFKSMSRDSFSLKPIPTDI